MKNIFSYKSSSGLKNLRWLFLGSFSLLSIGAFFVGTLTENLKQSTYSLTGDSIEVLENQIVATQKLINKAQASGDEGKVESFERTLSALKESLSAAKPLTTDSVSLLILQIFLYILAVIAVISLILWLIGFFKYKSESQSRPSNPVLVTVSLGLLFIVASLGEFVTILIAFSEAQVPFPAQQFWMMVATVVLLSGIVLIAVFNSLLKRPGVAALFFSISIILISSNQAFNSFMYGYGSLFYSYEYVFPKDIFLLLTQIGTVGLAVAFVLSFRAFKKTLSEEELKLRKVTIGFTYAGVYLIGLGGSLLAVVPSITNGDVKIPINVLGTLMIPLGFIAFIVAACALIADRAEDKGRSWQVFFWVSLLFNPVIMLVISEVMHAYPGSRKFEQLQNS